MRKTYLVTAFLFLIASFMNAQNWLLDMRNPRVNFFTVQREFNDWWASHGQEILSEAAKGEGEGESGEGWKIYKRWEHDMMPRMVATNGERLGPVSAGEKNLYRRERQPQYSRGASTWSYIGTPKSFNDGSGDSSTGRINCVRFDPINRDIIYCGAPTGGLWKSSDFGNSWQLLNTDNLPQIGLSDIVINPQNPNTIYIATGDIANAECLSVGIFKSVDGGQAWDTTGLSWTVSQGRLIARLLMSPIDSGTLFAATNTGVYKTTDGGGSWNLTSLSASLTGMEFNPSNPNTLYAWGTQLYKSVNAGVNWTQLSNGLPDAQSSGGFAIGLTPADTSCVYVLVTDPSTPTQSYSPYKGLYRSLNAGDTFTLQCSQPDPQGTQGTYDLNVSVSPVNENILIVAAVNSEFSTDGGVTFTGASFPSHVDHHDIRFFNGSGDTVFSADDGGLFISTDTGDTWTGMNSGMHIGEIYNAGSGSRTQYLYLTGRQDEGTVIQDTSYVKLVSPGDGMECLIDPLNENHIFGSVEEGIIGTSFNRGQNVSILVSNFFTGVNGIGAWNTPYAYVESDNAAALYVAKDFIYKSVDGGSNWNKLNSPVLHNSSDNLYQLMAIAPSDPNYIYASTYYTLYRSTDGGTTFTNITGGLSGQFTSLAVSESNPEEIWVGFSGGNKVLLKSVNAGSNFENFATGLPAGGPYYAVSIAPVKDSKDALYTSISNAGGVYYRDSTMSSWAPFSSGLPNVTVDQLEIDYCAGKIRAATYGRDLWESTPYAPLNVPPLASASYLTSVASCPDTVSFTDISAFYPTAWQWYFPGGQPASSTGENPVVIYPAGSTDTVTFIVSNANGADTNYYQITADICTGISQLNESNIVSIYPNPNNGNFTLSITGEARGKVDVFLMNNIGQIVYQYSFNKAAYTMTTNCSLSALITGIYYVRITSEGVNTVQKLVVDEQVK